MHIELAWWDLDENDPEVGVLSASLTNQILKEWELVPNLTMKFWLASEDVPRWGSLMIWHGDKPEPSKMPPNISAEIIRRRPDHRITFDVLHEASLYS